jgi:protein gp37
MGANTGIAWTDYTFNPWIGCSRVSPACAHCYAATLANTRMKLDVWDGKERKPRHITAASTWKQPLAWNRKAEREGRRYRVFCASMADVFENRADLDDTRARLWQLIEETPSLDWLLLTKRPENATGLTPNRWNHYDKGFPANVWIGTSVENQHWADIRIPRLLDVPAKVRFLSCEPLLGPVKLTFGRFVPSGPYSFGGHISRSIHWVICGGESGKGYRQMNLDWVRSLRDQCQEASIPFFYKQGNGLKPGMNTLLDGELVQEFPAGLKSASKVQVTA